MSDTIPEDRLLDLLALWEEAEQAGRPLDIDELAATAPDLRAELERRIGLLRGIRRLEAGSTDPGEAPSSHEEPTSFRHERYEVRGEIAQGGMGVVLRAFDRQLNREIALKVMHRDREKDPTLRLRFVEEAQLTGQLQHPGVPPIFERGEFDDDRPFYTMKLVKGRTLRDLLDSETGTRGASHRPDLARLVAIVEAIAQTVAYAHSKSVIHRDLKPSNVMVGAFGEVQVMDWGLAKVLGAARPEERAGSIVRTVRTDGPDSALRTGTVGTPAYMPPEQAQGLSEHVDARADVFAIGSILCEVLTGDPAYVGRNRDEVLRKAMRGDLAEAWQRLDFCGADDELIGLAKVCLAAEPLDRPGDASAVARRLADHQAAVTERWKNEEVARVEAETRVQEEAKRRALADELAREAHEHAQEATMRAAVERSRRRRTAALALTTIGLIALVLGGGAYFVRQRATRQLATARSMSEALAQADLAQGRAEGLADPSAEVAAWKEALIQAQRADDALRNGEPTAEDRGRVAARLSEILEKLQAAEQHQRDAAAEKQLVRALEEIRCQHVEHWDESRTSRAYLQAFRDAGLDLVKMGPEKVAAWITSREARDEILAGLDAWGLTLDRDEKAPEGGISWTRLLAVLRAADPDSWRRELRSLRGGPEKEALQSLLTHASDLRDLADRPLASLVLLAQLLFRAGERAESIKVFRLAWERHPDDFWVNFQLGIELCFNGKDLVMENQTEADRHLTAALALRPKSTGVRIALASTRYSAGRIDEAKSIFQSGGPAQDDDFLALCQEGARLTIEGKYAEATGAFRKVVGLRPNQPEAHMLLAEALLNEKKLDESLLVYREADRIAPGHPLPQVGIGKVLSAQGKPNEAIAAYQEAVRRKPDLQIALMGLAQLYQQAKRAPEAIATFQELLRLHPNDVDTRIAFGNYLYERAEYDSAREHYEEAIRNQPSNPIAHYDLANVFKVQAQYDKAVASYREALRLQPNYDVAHFNLGLTLQAQGHYDEALAELRKGHEIGSKKPNWLPDANRTVQSAERLASLAKRLPSVVTGQDQPANNDERLVLAQMCYENQYYLKAVGLWSEGMRLEPERADDRQVQHRYNAACAAALAGCREGKDEPPPDADGQTALRNQAHDWLVADLQCWLKFAESNQDRGRDIVVRTLDHWRRDIDLAGVRDEDRLKMLGTEESKRWSALWAEVSAAHDRLAKAP